MKFGDHITWGTYGTRLHGDPRGTVDREHNERGAPALGFDEDRWEHAKGNLKFPPVELTHEQRNFIEETIPIICVRGHWEHITSAARLDHVHTVLQSPFNPKTVDAFEALAGSADGEALAAPAGADVLGGVRKHSADSESTVSDQRDGLC